MALAKGARMAGARLIEGVRVNGVLQQRGRVTGVSTALGDIQADYVVNCAGMWARQLGDATASASRTRAAEHYLITEPIRTAAAMPVLEDPSSYGYYREEVGGLLVGLFEPVCAPWHVDGILEDFSFGEIPPDWERMTPYLETAMKRVPITLDVGIKKFFCGPESFTPDLHPIIGEAPELKNYFVAAGLNSIGILTGGGIGRLLAHWIVNGTPDADVTGFNIDRLHPYQANPEYRRERTIESLGLVYKCHYPTMTPQTARGVKTSAIHDRLAAAGAYFRDVSGWEGADWYAPPGFEPKVDKLSWGRQNWFPWWEAEHRAAREGVILMDMSFMSKFSVAGRDASRVLNHISANDVNGPAVALPTQWLNDKGTLEADHDADDGQFSWS
jgi:4-methylaminobutanoate oxidase (formaldehyde-forming)